MFAQFLIAFREGLEGALLTAILLAYLRKTQRGPLTRFIWYGVFGALGASFAIGFLINLLYGGLTGAVKPLFEGIAALFAVLVLSYMIYWMMVRSPTLRTDLEQRTESLVQQGSSWGLVSFAFVAVVREGIESVLFLTPFLMQDPFGTIQGSLLGVLAAILVALLFFSAGMKLNLRRFFYFTGVLLVFVAGGLVGYGVHELIEFWEAANVPLGWIAQPAFVLPFSADHPLHHKGVIGGIFATLFGYTVSPEWIRLIAHGLYLLIAFPLLVKSFRTSQSRFSPSPQGESNKPL